MKNFYLVAAVIGAIVPYVFFLQWFAAYGPDAAGFLQA